MAKQFGIPVKYENNLDLAKKFVDVYLAVNPPKSNMHIRAREALAYYLVYGYESKSDIKTMFSDQIDDGYMRSIKSLLRKNGYLIKDKYNQRKGHLSEEMIGCAKQLFENNQRIFIVGFIKDV